MKKNLLPVFAFVVISSSALAQINNPGFENWAGSLPVGWSAVNAALIESSSDAHSGSKAVKLITGSNAGGYLYSNDFAQSSVVGSIEGWYKSNMVSGDMASVAAFLATNSNQTTHIAATAITSSVNVYTKFTIDFQQVVAMTPDIGRITFTITGSAGSAHNGSWFLIDDLEWGEGSPVGVEEMASASSASLDAVFPNPSQGGMTRVQFTTSQSAPVQIDLYDLSGRHVLNVLNETMAPGEYRAEFNADDLGSGVYLCSLTVNGQTFVQRFVK